MIKREHFRLWAWIAVATTLCVIVLGAYVRLTHAGLGCPDWPGCYGHITWPNQSHEIEAANQAFPQRAVEVPKAWREMVHRFLAGALGLIVLALAISAARRHRPALLSVIAAAVLASAAIATYTLDFRTAALLPAALSIVLPLLAAWRLPGTLAERTVVASLGVIIFQALLGKWTVTLQLKPAIVTMHLLGGMTTFALLLWAALHSERLAVRWPALRGLALFSLVVLVIQIFLGGWTSTNYAALACPDFPQCQGSWWPRMDFAEAFVLWREIGVNYEGGILDAAARTAIHYTHRLWAVVVVLVLGALIWRLYRHAEGRPAAALLGGLLTLQIILGASNVWFDLPLPVATAHNGVAALLLGVLLMIYARGRLESRA